MLCSANCQQISLLRIPFCWHLHVIDVPLAVLLVTHGRSHLSSTWEKQESFTTHPLTYTLYTPFLPGAPSLRNLLKASISSFLRSLLSMCRSSYGAKLVRTNWSFPCLVASKPHLFTPQSEATHWMMIWLLELPTLVRPLSGRELIWWLWNHNLHVCVWWHLRSAG